MMSFATASERARYVRGQLPPKGLFSGQEFRIAPDPFPLEPRWVKELEFLGRVLLQFYRAANLLYRLSVAEKQPAWVARWLDLGKPAGLIELQRSPAFKNEFPRVIRPDLLLTDSGFSITELDSVPGGIGLTAWLNQTYSRLPRTEPAQATSQPEGKPAPLAAHTDERPAPPASQQDSRSEQTITAGIVGGTDQMLRGFREIFGGASRVQIVISEEASTYRPEMEWVVEQLGRTGSGKAPIEFAVRDAKFTEFHSGDAIYRFFELFDLANVKNAPEIFRLAQEKQIQLTPPPKTFLEEKMLFALLWNRNLETFWRQELGERFFARLRELVPMTWLVDPAPLPPHGAVPELNLTNWHQLSTLSQKERDLILKVSGFSEHAWGARGVYLGSDLSAADWTVAVERAIRSFEASPFILQRYHKPKLIETAWFDFDRGESIPMAGRTRLCPYYFVTGDGDAARAQLGGVLATICPANKKIIHGMSEAILAPCAFAAPS